MSESRKKLIAQAFAKLDNTGDHQVTVEDLAKVYDVKKHPKYQSGEMTKKQILAEYLETFEKDGSPGEGDGVVSTESF